MQVSEHSWVVASVRAGRGADAVAALSARGVRARHFRRLRRPSPVAGRPDLDPALFPLHIFVHEAGLGDLAGGAVPGVERLFRNEKGRALCLPDHVIVALGEYCDLAGGDAIPAHLAPLDLLGGAERIWFVLETWMQWPPADPLAATIADPLTDRIDGHDRLHA